MNTMKIDNARIFYRNFAGNVSDYNRLGKRTFCVELDHEMAESLREDGWNVKTTKPKNEDYFPTEYIQVEVSYRLFSPDIFCYFGNKYRRYTENTVQALDHLQFEHIDLVLQVSQWSYMGKTGLKGYLMEFHGVVAESPYAEKYKGYIDMDTPEVEPNGEELPF